MKHERIDGAGVPSILLYSESNSGVITRRGGYRGRLQVVERDVSPNPYHRHTGMGLERYDGSYDGRPSEGYD